jgi:glycosyltransferase involved in cell wall biosynthesis
MFPLGPPVFEQFAERRIPVVFDFDDAIFLPTTNPHNRLAARFKSPDKVAQIISGAAHTTVGNEYLAQYARRFSNEVSILPTTLDTVIFDRPADWRRPPGPIRIGWTGSSTTTSYLHSIDGALRRLLTKHDVELVVIGGDSYTLPGAPNVRTKPWRLDTEISDVLDLDIGIMPLTNDEFALGKCGFKALLYMSLGIPCVVSPVGVNTSIVHDGVNGLLASSEDEWVDVLETLIGDEDLRRRLGVAGRTTVVSHYNGKTVAPEFLNILARAAASSPGSS